MEYFPEEKSETAAKILEAADELIVEAGYDGISMRAVAKRAGVNKALVFYYFNSKAHLIERVLERYYTAHLAALEEAFQGEGSLSERLHRLIDAYLDFIEANLRYPRLIQQQVAAGDNHHAFIQRNLAPLFEWTVRALSELTPESGPQAARHFFVSFSGIVINYYTYAPVLGALWGSDPMSKAALAERREHVHWMLDAFLENLREEDSRDRNSARGRASL